MTRRAKREGPASRSVRPHAERKGVVHSNLHMDMDIRNPTVSLDGLVIIRDGKFVDSVLNK